MYSHDHPYIYNTVHVRVDLFRHTVSINFISSHDLTNQSIEPAHGMYYYTVASIDLGYVGSRVRAMQCMHVSWFTLYGDIVCYIGQCPHSAQHNACNYY